MKDETLQAAYAELLDARGDVRAGCVAPAALLAVADGTAPEAERLRTLRHVGSCRHCRADLDLLRTASDAAAYAVRPVQRRTPLLAAAAGIVLLLGGVALWEANRGPVPETLRQAPTGAVRLLAPPEDSPAAPPVTLAWAPVPDARRYEVEIVRQDGGVVFATTTRDTVLVIPESTALAPGGDYRWWVRAVLADGTQPRSLVRRLRIASP